jgi:glycosyltransferase involved in cell wall biosynthesis
MPATRILFVSEAADASPTRYRALAYFERLRAAGYEPAHLAVTGLVPRLRLAHVVKSFDIVVVLRKMFTAGFVRLLRGRNRKLVFDLDDALFAKDDGTTPDVPRRRFAAMAGAADLVWAGNPHLAGEAARHGSAIVLPTSVDPAKYGGGSLADPSHLDVVWIGSSSTRKYLEAVLPILAAAAKRIPGLRLKIVADFDLPGAGLQTVPVAWSEATEAEALRASHIGIAPLPDDPWTRGKCGLKILQYMAAGLPVIASPVGVQRDMVLRNLTGLLAATREEWIFALEQLAASPTLRAAMGTAGREHVRAHFSVDATFAKMRASLDQLA